MTRFMDVLRRVPYTILITVILTVGLSCAAAAAKRVAFVLGISAYVHADVLPNTINDARATAAALRRLGFAVFEVLDPDAKNLRRSLVDLRRRLQGADLGLFYYAGHGMAIDGMNYIFPTDANLRTESNIDTELVSVHEVLRQFQAQPKHLKLLVFLDACRINPFYEQVRSFGTRAVGRGLAKIEGIARRKRGGLARMGSDAIDMFVAFATQPGNLAVDGLQGDVNSPFTKALVQHLGTRVEVREMMTKVRASVVAYTNQIQIPWDQSSLTNPVYLAGKPAPKVEIRTVPIRRDQGVRFAPPP